MKNLIKSLFPSKKDRDVKQLWPYVEAVNEVYVTMQELTDDELRAKSQELKQRIASYTEETTQAIAQLREEADQTLDIREKETIFDQIDELTKRH